MERGVLPKSAILPSLYLSALSVVLLFIRIIYLQTGLFNFMAWNLALAWLPLGAAVLLDKQLVRTDWLKTWPLLTSLAWLILLPNSFYMASDFIHLARSTSDSILFDGVMFLCFTLAGLLLGCMSVWIVHRRLLIVRAKRTVNMALVSVFLLSGLAIYLGRNLGWNSWDVVLNPFFILLDFVTRLTDAELLATMAGTSLLFAVLIATVYVGFYQSLESVNFKK